MIKIFTGDNRLAATKAIADFLGPEYEVIEGATLTPELLPSVCLGGSLFVAKRSILIRDLSESPQAFAELPKYIQTPHKIAIFESKIDKRLATYKTLKEQVEVLDFPAAPDPNRNLVFDIYKTAKTNGRKAVELLRRIETQEEPIKFAGLLNSQALKDFAKNQGNGEKRTLKSLATLDLQLKSSPLNQWRLIEAFLLSQSLPS